MRWVFVLFCAAGSIMEWRLVAMGTNCLGQVGLVSAIWSFRALTVILCSVKKLRSEHGNGVLSNVREL